MKPENPLQKRPACVPQTDNHSTRIRIREDPFEDGMFDFLLQSPKLLASLDVLVLEIDNAMQIQRILPTSYEFSHYLPQQLQGRQISSFLDASQSRMAQEKILACTATGEPQKIDIWLDSDKTGKCIQASICPLTKSSVLVIGKDISPIRKIQQELDKRTRFYTYLISHCSDMITVIGSDATIVFESPALQSVLGKYPHEVVGAHLRHAIHPADWNRTWAAIEQTRENQTSRYFEFRRKDGEGNWIDLEGLATNLLEDEAIAGIIINARNITERKKLEKERQKNLFQDPLTGLSNRTRLLDRLSQSINQCRRNPGFQFALLLINLDRFQSINKTMGWEIGDQFLLNVARFLKSEFRGVDTIARIGSDEFGLLVNGFADARAPIRIAERLKERMGHAFRLQGMEIPFSANMGLAYGSMRYNAPEQLVNDASTALYKAKTDQCATYRIFHSKMHIQTLNLLQMENELRKAVERQEMILYYQPILDLFSKSIVSVEALIRWQHPQKGLIGPDQFIPLAEESGLILPIGQWVVEQACREILRINKERGSSWMLSVNLSARQLSDPNLFANLQAILQKTRFPAALLQLEMTETALIRREQNTHRLFERFKQTGLKLAIDDFGTGYSSLKYLHDYPFDTLKIDRSFIWSLNNEITKNEKIIQSVITLADHLDMQIIAEGIENRYQMEKMKTLDCCYGQGFYFSKPVPATDLPNLPETLEPAGATLSPV